MGTVFRQPWTCTFPCKFRLLGQFLINAGLLFFTAVGSHGSQRQLIRRDAAESLGTMATAPGQEAINVVYGVDWGPGQVTMLLSSMASLTKGLSAPWRSTVHIIVPSNMMENMRAVIGCFHREVGRHPAAPAVVLHEMLELPPSIRHYMSQMRRAPQDRVDLIRPTCFARLYLDHYLPEGNKRALWLDVDTIVQGDIGALFSLPMQHSVAAVRKFNRTMFTYLNTTMGLEHAMALPNARNKILFNAGVLLIDLDRWRTEQVARKLEDIAATWKVPHGSADQLLLNMHFQGNFDILDTRWNIGVMYQNDSTSQLNAAKILHWNGHRKPWYNHSQEHYDLWARFDLEPRCRASLADEEARARHEADTDIFHAVSQPCAASAMIVASNGSLSLAKTNTHSKA